jgi:hypothetical protein
MSKGNTFENDLVLLIFNGIPITGLADVGVADPINVLWVSLHTSDPAEAGDQSSGETAYSGYTRIGVERSALGWSVANGVAENVEELIFPASLNDSIPITHCAIGTEETGPGKILHYGQLVDPISIYIDTQPSFPVGKLRAGEE